MRRATKAEPTIKPSEKPMAAASKEPVDAATWSRELRGRGLDWVAISGPDLDTWIADATILTDDFAPVDQLLTAYPAS